MAKKVINKKFDMSKFFGSAIIGLFFLFLGSFIYEAVNAENLDSNKRWCANCNTYHDINDETLEEIWCNNCQTWHAPNEESRSSKIN